MQSLLHRAGSSRLKPPRGDRQTLASEDSTKNARPELSPLSIVATAKHKAPPSDHLWNAAVFSLLLSFKQFFILGSPFPLSCSLSLSLTLSHSRIAHIAHTRALVWPGSPDRTLMRNMHELSQYVWTNKLSQCAASPAAASRA